MGTAPRAPCHLASLGVWPMGAQEAGGGRRVKMATGFPDSLPWDPQGLDQSPRRPPGALLSRGEGQGGSGLVSPP